MIPVRLIYILIFQKKNFTNFDKEKGFTIYVENDG